METYQLFIFILNICAAILSLALIIVNIVRGEGGLVAMWAIILLINVLAVSLRISTSF